MKLTKRKAFNFLRSYFDVLNELKENSDKLDFLMSIINKQFLNEDPKELGFISKLCYESQRHSIESSVKGWIRANNTDMEGNLLTTPTTDPPTLVGSTPKTNPKEEKEEVKEKEEEQLKEAETLYSLYPSKTVRNGKECQTKSRDKNIKKLLILLSDKKHTFESLKLLIETELKGKDEKNGLYQFLRGFEVFLNNLPDVDGLDVDPNALDEKYVYYQWKREPSKMARRVLKEDAKKLFEGQLLGGYEAVILKSIKNKTKVWS